MASSGNILGGTPNVVNVKAEDGWVKISINGKGFLNMPAADYGINPQEAAVKVAALFEGRKIEYKNSDEDFDLWVDGHWIDLSGHGRRQDFTINQFETSFANGLARPLGIEIDVEEWWVNFRMDGKCLFAIPNKNLDDQSINNLKTILEKRTMKYDDRKIYVDNQIILDFSVKSGRLYTVQEILRTLEEKLNLSSPLQSTAPQVSPRLAFLPPPAPSSGTDAPNANAPENIPGGPGAGR
jgi:hypothetical protein